MPVGLMFMLLFFCPTKTIHVGMLKDYWVVPTKYIICSTISLNDHPCYKALAGNKKRSHLQSWLPWQYLSAVTGHPDYSEF